MIAKNHTFILCCCLFVYFEREYRKGRERGRENPNPTDGAEPDVGLELTNGEIMTSRNQESDA